MIDLFFYNREDYTADRLYEQQIVMREKGLNVIETKIGYQLHDTYIHDMDL